MTAAQRIKCEICDHTGHYLPDHLAEAHNLTVEAYLADHPNAPLESDAVIEMFDKSIENTRRKAPPALEELYTQIGDFRFRVNHDVPEEACLPLPDHYRLPKYGGNAKACKRILRYLTCGRSVWCHGGPGGGKDALPSAWSWWTRTPSEIFPINPDVDIQPWFFYKTFDENGVVWKYGRLFDCLVNGYTSPSGRRHPMLIVLSDFDRAGRSQADAIRLVADSIEGRVKGPDGKTYKVLPGTLIYITANTMGSGDPTGKAVSANVIDSTIINRIERKVLMPMMDWRDEEPIIRAKFPRFAEVCGDLLKNVGNAVSALRKAVENGDLYGEFSHRDLCTWIGDCEDILTVTSNPPKDLLKQGFMSYCEGLPDPQTVQQALTLCDPHFKGGTLERGDTSHVDEDDLQF